MDNNIIYYDSNLNSLPQKGNYYASAETPSKDKVLYVFAMGLGGIHPSFELLEYLKKHCKTHKYVIIHAFGKDEGKGSYTPTSYVLSEIIKKAECTIWWASHHFLDLPLLTPFRLNEEIRDLVLKLQNPAETYKMYESMDFSFPGKNDDEIITKISNSFTGFFEAYPNGDILIDNHAVIYGHPPSNFNFEYMPWLPKVLASIKKDDHIFLLKGVNAVPFFSPEAVYKHPPAEMKFLKSNDTAAGGAGAGAGAGARAGGTRKRRQRKRHTRRKVADRK